MEISFNIETLSQMCFGINKESFGQYWDISIYVLWFHIYITNRSIIEEWIIFTVALMAISTEVEKYITLHLEEFQDMDIVTDMLFNEKRKYIGIEDDYWASNYGEDYRPF